MHACVIKLCSTKYHVFTSDMLFLVVFFITVDTDNLDINIFITFFLSSPVEANMSRDVIPISVLP